MAPPVLDGATLGKKHQHYNKMVREQQGIQEPSKLDSGQSDIENLIKIDIAHSNKDVEYILEVFKSEDTLYASRAIKRSGWLINDQQYAHIINPEYLYDQVFPQMTSKAIKKLMLHIRVTLKDEQRASAFYKYEHGRDRGKASKWLPLCSIAFIEQVLKKPDIPISDTLLKRLIKKTFSALEIYTRNQAYYSNNVLETNKIFLNTNTEKFLNLIESWPNSFEHFGEKYTKVVMNKYPQLIINNFQKYAFLVDTKTFVKYIKREEIKDFLIQHSNNKKLASYFNYRILKEYVTRMPVKDRFEFVKEIFIDKNPKSDESLNDWNSLIVNCTVDTCTSVNEYQWYEFAPFEIAFPDLKKLIRAESSPRDRNNMLKILISCSRHNMLQIQTVLQFYHDKHINESFKFKCNFVNTVLSMVDTHKFDEKTWNVLNELFHSMEVYDECSTNVQPCIEAIITYKILHGQNVPEIIMKKIEFTTFRATQKKLKSKEEKSTVFNFLYINMLTKVYNKCVTTEFDFHEMVLIIKHILNLLIDWNKELFDHPIIVNKIRELIKIRKDNLWKIELTSIYNIKKSWRKLLFEESIIMCPSENVCMNALKHDPELLLRHESEVGALCNNDAVSLKRLHSKLRVYWPQTLAKKWIQAYLERLDKSGSHKSLIRSLCVLLSEKPLLDIVKKYAPTEGKINWDSDDEVTLSLRKHISKSMHIARPLITLDAVLLYAKGDYLQYAVPSINAILYDQSYVKSTVEIPKLLNAPVSLQKYGIRYAFQKFKPQELKTIFYELWKSSTNPTLRTVIFTHTYDLLCKEKNHLMINELNHLLCLFIENLKDDENKKIYNKLSMVLNVPLDVRAEVYMKSYLFLNSLPKKSSCASIVQSLLNYAPSIMHLLQSEFVEDVLLKSIVELFSESECDIFDILISYLLCAKNEESQFRKYTRTLLPIIDYQISQDLLQTNKFYYTNVILLLQKTASKLKIFLMMDKAISPVKIFTDIQEKLENMLTIHENYDKITFWKLTVCYVKLVDDYKKSLVSLETDMITDNRMSEDRFSNDANKKWKKMNSSLEASFADHCVNYLKEDVNKYFPSIYSPFGRALGEFFRHIHSDNYMLQCNILHLLLREDFIQSYLLVISTYLYSYKEDEMAKILEIRKTLSKHTSPEVKMHYYSRYRNKSESEI